MIHIARAALVPNSPRMQPQPAVLVPPLTKAMRGGKRV